MNDDLKDVERLIEDQQYKMNNLLPLIIPELRDGFKFAIDTLRTISYNWLRCEQYERDNNENP
jgi:hypothetical protein